MIVVMKSNATKENVKNVIRLVKEMGLKEHVIEGTDLTVVAVIGDDRRKSGEALEQADGVDRVMRVLAPYKLASIETQPERTVVKLGESCTIGGTDVAVIAGPCSVEGRDQILDTAKMVKASGANALRGGAFKPRTNPYLSLIHI